MAKKKTKKKLDTVVKNEKRVPASEKGKGKKPKPEKPAPDEKAKRKAQIAQKVWKATEAHRSTIGKLAALVDTFEEYDLKSETLKDEIGGLKGQIAEDKAEIRRIVKDENDAETVDLRKLEKDITRREVQLAGKQEERSGSREAMKCAMADIRKIIKEGPGLFEEKGTDDGPTGAGKAPSPKSASSNGEKPKAPQTGASKSAAPSAPSSTSANATPPPSKSPASPSTPTPAPSATADDDIKQALKNITCADVIDRALYPMALEGLDKAGVITLEDAANRGKTFLTRNCNLVASFAQKIFDRIHEIRHPEDKREPAAV